MTHPEPHRDELRALLHQELDRARTRRLATRAGVLSLVLLVCAIPIVMGPGTPGRPGTPEQIAKGTTQTATRLEPIPNVMDRVRVLEARPGLVDRVTTGPDNTRARSVRRLSDAELIDALEAAGQPSGFVRTETDFQLIALGNSEGRDRSP